MSTDQTRPTRPIVKIINVMVHTVALPEESGWSQEALHSKGTLVQQLNNEIRMAPTIRSSTIQQSPKT